MSLWNIAIFINDTSIIKANLKYSVIKSCMMDKKIIIDSILFPYKKHGFG